LKPDDLIGYLHSVDILLNDNKDFKYFLPRLLELELLADDYTKIFYDQVWTLLGRTEHELWPIRERNVLKAFSQVYLDKASRENIGDRLKIAHLDLAEARLDIVNNS
jgi:hypothetical protein